MDTEYTSGRKRASSESSLLEEDDIEKYGNNSPLSKHHREVSKSLHLSNVKSLSVNPVEVIADGPLNSSSLPKSKKKSRPSFKYVMNLMNRLKNSSNSEKTGVDVGGPKGGWTPLSQRRNGLENGKSTQSDSSSRPLITSRSNHIMENGPRRIIPGTVGVHNHGNTCFMNAVIQCLSNTDWFSRYFMTKQYKDDMKNKSFSKKLSIQKSDVTEQLAGLLESLWTNNYHPDISNNFKSVVGKNNSQYKGTEQHDAQEFMLWLLDRLNEDIFSSNKRKDKNSRNNSVSISDEAAAKEVLAQNSGCVLYNLFQALFRSSLQCPKCIKFSNTFETYLCLSLPLPFRTKRPVYIIYVSPEVDPMQFKFGLMLSVHDTVKELRQAVSEFIRISPSRIVLCQIYEDGIRSRYCDDQPLTDIHEMEFVYALETQPPQSQGQSAEEFEASYIQLIVINTEKRTSPTKYTRFCAPVILSVPRDIDYRRLQKEILSNMNECVKEGLLSQKLEVLFRLRVVDEFSSRSCMYLQEDQEIMPLFTQAVESALSYGEEYGPQHLELVAEWDPLMKERVIIHDNDVIEEDASVRRVKMSQQQPLKVSLDQCIQLFTKEEKLSGEDGWECPHCHKQQQGATKTLGLWSLPDVLVIHLKRFRQVGLRRSKLSTLVDFPIRGLDMSQHVVRPPEQDSDTLESEMLYDLYAVANHYGNMQGGHYTAFCRNPLDERWYEFDDSKVKPMSEAEVKTSSAYLLFYQRRGVIEATEEDLLSGSHWIYKIYPAFQPSSLRHLNTSNNAVSNQPDCKENSSIKNPHVKNQSSGLHSESQPLVSKCSAPGGGNNESTPDTAWIAKDETDSLVKPSQLKQQQKKTEEHDKATADSRTLILSGNAHAMSKKTPLDMNAKLVHQTNQNHYANGISGHQTKFSQETKPKIDISEKKNLPQTQNGSGLTVKLPKNEVFIVRQNHATGQTSVQPFDKNFLPQKQELIVQNLNSINVKHHNMDSIKNDINDSMQHSKKMLSKDVDSFSHMSDPQKTSYDARASFRADNTRETHPKLSINRTSSNITNTTWSTPQTHRKEPPTPPDYNRQLSGPTRAGQNEVLMLKNGASKRSKSQPRPFESEQNRINEFKNQDQGHVNGFVNSFKSATIARTNHRQDIEEYISQNQIVHRSSTDSSIKDSLIHPAMQSNIPAKGTPHKTVVKVTKEIIPNSPHLHQAGSRKPVYDAVVREESNSYTEGFPRYQPHKHYRKTPTKKEEHNLKKEKMYSPCMKESSV